MPEHYIEQRVRCWRCGGDGTYVIRWTWRIEGEQAGAMRVPCDCEDGYRAYRTPLAHVAGRQIEGGTE